MAVIRRRTALAASVAAAVTFGAASLVAVPAAAAPGNSEGAAPIGLRDGTLDWGFKESFRKYLLSPIAQGRIDVADGAEQAPDNGPFTFTGGTGTYDTGTHAVRTGFQGSVRFQGHHGALDITLSDLQVTTTGTGGSVTADVTSSGEGRKSATDDDVPLADLDLSGIRPGQGEGGAMVFEDIPATLTAEGAKAFQDFYKEGTALDAATLTVTPDSASPGQPSGEPTGGSTPTAQPTGRPSVPAPGPSPSESVPAGPAEVADATLSWGLKDSFRRYIQAGGDIAPAGGAVDNGDGYDFPLAEAELDGDAHRLDATFDGSVRFSYPGHGIDMTFSGFEVKTEGTKGTLLADVKTPQGTDKDVEFATLGLDNAEWVAKEGVVLLEKLPATLTAAGAQQFENETTGSSYPAGTELDPATLALAVADGAQLPGGSGGSGDDSGTGGNGAGGTGGTVGGAGSDSLAATGSSAPTAALLAGAGALAVVGAGAVFVARRRPAAERS